VKKVGDVLHDAAKALEHIETVEPNLVEIVDALQVAVPPSLAHNMSQLPTSIDQLLRKRYTMGSERVIHDRHFGIATSAAAPAQAAEEFEFEL
jgi:hypothetical protein